MITPEQIVDDLETLANEIPEDAAGLGQSLAQLLIDILALYSGRDSAKDDPHHKCLQDLAGALERERYKVGYLMAERNRLLVELEEARG